VHPAELVAHTLRLRGELAPEPLAARWGAAATTGLARLVEFEGCALWLERRVQQIGASALIERGFATWLRRRAYAAAAQNLLIDAQVTTVARLLAEWGVPHVFLKGAARRTASELYPFADARATHDVDVLVPAGAAQPVWDRLRAAGYEPALRPGETPPEHHHLPAVWDRGRVAVEIHRSTSPWVAPALAWDRANAGARDIAREGLRLRVPSATELLWGGLSHGLRHRANGFRLHFLLDGAAIWASGVPIDWGEIGRRLEAGECGRRADAGAWLGAAAWLGGPRRPGSGAADVRDYDVAAALRRRWTVLRYVTAQGRVGELVCWWTGAWARHLALA
jgi:hypothetical protein